MGQANQKSLAQPPKVVDESKVTETPPKVVDGTRESKVTETPKVVVGLDFGTTHSGFAFAHRSEPDEVYLFTDWPCAPRSYCKGQTSLFYVPQEAGLFKLEDWSWAAAEKFVVSSRQFLKEWAKDHPELPSPRVLEAKAGVLATNFKLLLAEGGGKPNASVFIVDYLCCISEFIIEHLREKYGKAFNPQEVQWCLTVPAIWSEEAKAKMENFMLKALCSNLASSIYPLRIILEPEAASFCCQRQLREVLSFAEGDRFLVADLGGGTIDIVVHEKETALDKTHRVREVDANSGILGGGTYVDSNFLSYLEGKIGCFDKTFQMQEPDVVQRVLEWWLGPKGKCTFDGNDSKVLEVPRKLSKAWKKHDADHCLLEILADDHYEEVEISSEAICAMFDTEIGKAIKLIKEKLHILGNIKYIFLVGGFSENRYVARRIKEQFSNGITDVLSPPNPGAAICRGAVSLGVGTGVVVSRISKRWYGIEFSPPSRADDPPELIYMADGISMCRNRFQVFVKKGQAVPENEFVTESFFPVYKNQKSMTLRLFSSNNDAEPLFSTSAGCEKLQEYSFNLDRMRDVAVCMSFGKSCIEVFARRVNFGKNREFEKLYDVDFDAASGTVNK